MMVADTDERLMLKYVRKIRDAKTKDELYDIDHDITWNDDISTTGYAVLMNVIDIREEALR